MKVFGFVAAAAISITAGAAVACPDKTIWGDSYAATGAELYSAKGADVGSLAVRQLFSRAGSFIARVESYNWVIVEDLEPNLDAYASQWNHPFHGDPLAEHEDPWDSDAEIRTRAGTVR